MKAEGTKLRRRTSRRTLVILATVLTGITIAALSLSLAPQEPSTAKLAIDWRFKLTIHDARTGTDYTPPANIGVPGGTWANHTLDSYGPAGYAPLNTRDTSGTVYVQSTVCDTSPKGFCPSFTLGDFFNIWGQQFDNRCVPNGRDALYCAGHSNPPPHMSDGRVETCVNRSAMVADGKNYLVVIGSSLPMTCQ